jgi:N-acetylated-alpha-linked acidic dipeptidase
VGTIIFSDPKDDGHARADAYPEGPMRPGDGVQRGSVLDLTIHPGDPQTP